jgi:hypothetical protein
MGERFADDNIVNRAPHGGGVVMAGAVISYGQQIQMHFIYSNLNAHRYCDEIPRPIVVPFICRHHPRFQHDNPQPHVRICTQFLEAENTYTPDMSPIEHVRDALD